MAIARISITIPAKLLTQLDRAARGLGRSRSWAVAEAVRTFVETPAALPAPRAVREPTIPYGVSPGLGEQRLSQLTSDLALSPTERVRAAAATGRVGRPKKRGPARLLQFDRYEDYLDWQNGEGLLS